MLIDLELEVELFCMIELLGVNGIYGDEECNEILVNFVRF